MANYNFQAGDKVRITEGEERNYCGLIEKVEHHELNDDMYIVYVNESGHQVLVGGNVLQNIDDQTYMESVKFSETIFLEATEPVDDTNYKKHFGGKLQEIRQEDPHRSKLIVAVDRNDTSGIPHFHVFKNQKDLKSWSNSACLLFQNPQYGTHEGHSETLNDQELTAIVNYLSMETAEDIFQDTIWQYLIQLWNNANRYCLVPLDTPMPDYESSSMTFHESTIQNTDQGEDIPDVELTPDSFMIPFGDTWNEYVPYDVEDREEYFSEKVEIYPKYLDDLLIKYGKIRVCMSESAENTTPYVEVYFNRKLFGDKNSVAYISLCKNEYAPEFLKESRILTTSEMGYINNFMNEIIPGVFHKDELDRKAHPVTCWEECRNFWLSRHSIKDRSYFERDCYSYEFIMPDYRDIFVPDDSSNFKESTNQKFTEITLIAKNPDYGISICTNNQNVRMNVPYFEVYDHVDPNQAKRVVCLHFHDPKIEYRKDLGKQPFHLSTEDQVNLHLLLRESCEQYPQYSNWQILCYQWNKDHQFTEESLDDFLNPNTDHSDHDNRFVLPSTPIPKTWDLNLSNETQVQRFETSLREKLHELKHGNPKTEFALSIQVAKDEYADTPYFKVFDSVEPKQGVTRECRLHFKDSGVDYNHDGYKDWEITDEEVAFIQEFLQQPSDQIPEFTNWQMICYLWNFNHGFIQPSQGYQYFAGEFDQQFHGNHRYLLHDIQMPQTWNYDLASDTYVEKVLHMNESDAIDFYLNKKNQK